MSKFSLFFKESVVSSYLEGVCGSETIAQRFGIDAGTVRKWVAIHAVHGLAGLSKKRSHYDGAFKLSVLQRMWEDGLSHRQAAALFNIRHPGCLSDWERRYKDGGIEALEPRRRGRPRLMPEPPPQTAGPDGPAKDDAKSRDELLAELAYLRMENAYLKKLEALTQARRAPNGHKPSRR